MAERWYSWFAASGFASLFAYTEFVDSRFQHAGWPWPRRTIREVIPRRLWLPATRRRRRCPRCPSYTVTLAYNSLAGEKQLHVTGGGTARVRRWSTWRSVLGAALSTVPMRNRNFDGNERRTKRNSGHCHPDGGVDACTEDGSSSGWRSSLGCRLGFKLIRLHRADSHLEHLCNCWKSIVGNCTIYAAYG